MLARLQGGAGPGGNGGGPSAGSSPAEKRGLGATRRAARRSVAGRGVGRGVVPLSVLVDLASLWRNAAANAWAAGAEASRVLPPSFLGLEEKHPHSLPWRSCGGGWGGGGKVAICWSNSNSQFRSWLPSSL